MTPQLRNFFKIVFWSLVAMSVFDRAVFAQEGGKSDATLITIRENALQHSSRIGSGTAVSWQTRISFPGGASVVVDVTREGSSTKNHVHIGPELSWSVISHDGFWYVDDGKTLLKYREFEAPLPFGGLLVLLNQSDLSFLLETEGVQIEEQESQKHSGIALRIPLSETQRSNFQSMLKKMNELSAMLASNGRDIPKSQADNLKSIEDVLQRGLPVRVDLQTGAILYSAAAPGRTIEWSDIAWDLDVKSFTHEVQTRKWTDRSSPIQETDLPNLVQIGWDRNWRPGVPPGDPDLMLLNVVTHEVRRVPFPFGSALAGCFSPDRKNIYLTGTNMVDASLQIFQVNLLTGETSLVGDEPMRQGMWMVPTASPDGRYLAAAQFMAGSALKSQIHVIDLETQTSRPIGEPLDVASLSWNPDGQSLIGTVRHTTSLSEVPIAKVTEIRLDGSVTELASGSFSVLLPSLNRILYKSKEGKLNTCKLDGSDEETFDVGDTELGFPAPSNDGRLMMMKFEKGKAPVPCLIDIKTRKTTPLPLQPGLWSTPRWN